MMTHNYESKLLDFNDCRLNLILNIQDFDEEMNENERFFDPTYIEVDRILQCVELFPIIHPKKANEIKGKWSELIVIIT